MTEPVSDSVIKIFAELAKDKDLSYDIRHAYEKHFAQNDKMGKNPQDTDLNAYFGALGQKIYNMVQTRDVEDIVHYFALNRRASEFNKI